MPNTKVKPIAFDEVLLDELAHIKLRRQRLSLNAQGEDLGDDPGPLLGEIRKDVRKDHDEEKRVRRPRSGGAQVRDDDQGGAREANQDEAVAAARMVMLKENLAGLAFSGGGIRSATFAVGILQGLAGLRLLRFFDVLSTVSGGGYAGGWLATWIRREGDPLDVERQLNSSRIVRRDAFRTADEQAKVSMAEVVDEEPEPIRHLRSVAVHGQ